MRLPEPMQPTGWNRSSNSGPVVSVHHVVSGNVHFKGVCNENRRFECLIPLFLGLNPNFECTALVNLALRKVCLQRRLQSIFGCAQFVSDVPRLRQVVDKPKLNDAKLAIAQRRPKLCGCRSQTVWQLGNW